VATDAPNVGHLILDGNRRRDAIHVAVAPVTADGFIIPGQRLIFSRSSTERVLPTDTQEGIGIADPFLRRPIRTGERFWMFLHPNTVTSLRHYWSHPAFSAQATSTKEVVDEEG
jgi:hypothetical protein